MWMKRIMGRKNERGKDIPLMIFTQGWEIPTNDEVLQMVDVIFENEDRIYPRPQFKGSGMFLDEILKRYVEYMKR